MFMATCGPMLRAEDEIFSSSTVFRPEQQCFHNPTTRILRALLSSHLSHHCALFEVHSRHVWSFYMPAMDNAHLSLTQIDLMQGSSSNKSSQINSV